MPPNPSFLPTGACPASAVILATRQAQTPLAIANAQAAGATLLFANDAFAAMLDCEPEALVGRELSTLAVGVIAPIRPASTLRFDLATAKGGTVPAALSVAAVPGPDGLPLCLLCSLVDARGDGADEAIARDAILLKEVAHAAGELMRESTIAARVADSSNEASTTSGIAFDAVAHASQVIAGDRA